MNKEQIFLLGTGKSGTTLLQRMINKLDNFMIFGEHGGFLKDIAEAYFLNFENKDIISYITNKNKKEEDPNELLMYLKQSKFNPVWTNFYNKEVVKRNFRKFIESFFYPKELKYKLNWGFKEIRYGQDRVMEMLIDLYPNSRFIYIIRNPVDVISSQLSTGGRLWKKKNIGELAKIWNNQNKKFIEFYNKYHKNCFLIKYEYLISKRESFNDLLDWLGQERKKSYFEVLDIKIGRTISKYKFTNKEIKKIKEITYKFYNSINWKRKIESK